VVRRSREGVRVLVVSARRRRNRWVLPKGTVQTGEAPAAAALREVREEAGVTGRARGRGSVAEYNTRGGRVRVEYFLIEFRRESGDGEGRRVRWCAVEDAIALLTYASARRALLESNDKIRRLARPPSAAKRPPRARRK
jgi:8-oxo-dGTP pyrophosphatase MutT (NUDIX family)